MPLGYKEAFGLSDNPFGPRKKVGQLPPSLTAELEKKPLLLHKDEALEQLYCERISSFQAACENLSALLDADGYVTGSSEGVASYLIGIDGDRGAGKTTLACRMLKLMLSRYPKDEPGRGVEEVFLRSASETMTEQSDKLKALEGNGSVTKAAYRCILVDDLLTEAYPYVVQLYDKLQKDCAVFMIFTSYDPKMAEQIDKSLRSVQHFRIAPLTADDTIAYISARYRMFRMPSQNGLSAEPLFPFDENDIRTAVAVRVINGAAATGPINLRLIASTLNSALTNRLQALAREKPAFDVHGISAAELAPLKIKLAQSYNVVVRI